MESIFETVKNTALIHKSGGGTGFLLAACDRRTITCFPPEALPAAHLFHEVFDAATDA